MTRVQQQQRRQQQRHLTMTTTNNHVLLHPILMTLENFFDLLSNAPIALNSSIVMVLFMVKYDPPLFNGWMMATTKHG